MFTGIVVGVGRIATIRAQGGGRRLQIDTPEDLGEVGLGDSVAVSGVCLTAVEIEGNRLAFDLVEETLRRSTLGDRRVGDGVNLELPLRPSDRLGGHFVQGHVDGVGTIRAARPQGGDYLFQVQVEPDLTRWMVEKGSITIDGVSLTLTEVGRDAFSVSLIPHTREITTLGQLRPGSRVNLEVDLLAKYVEKLVRP